MRQTYLVHSLVLTGKKKHTHSDFGFRNYPLPVKKSLTKKRECLIEEVLKVFMFFHLNQREMRILRSEM